MFLFARRSCLEYSYFTIGKSTLDISSLTVKHIFISRFGEELVCSEMISNLFFQNNNLHILYKSYNEN